MKHLLKYDMIHVSVMAGNTPGEMFITDNSGIPYASLMPAIAFFLGGLTHG